MGRVEGAQLMLVRSADTRQAIYGGFMKICSCTIAFQNKTWKETLRAFQEIGIPCVEGSAEDWFSGHLQSCLGNSQEVNRIKNLTESLGMEIVAIMGSNDFTLEEKHLPTQIMKAKTYINLTAEIGAAVLRIFAGHIKKEQVKNEHYLQVRKCLKEIVGYAKNKKVVLALENHYGITGTAEEMLRVIEEIDEEFLGINLDPANFVFSGEDPVEATKKLMKYVKHMHLKDCRKDKGKYEYCEIGAGEIDWLKILQIARNNNYSGYLSLEYEKAEDCIRGTGEGFNSLKALLEK